jgi:hypothetical protein
MHNSAAYLLLLIAMSTATDTVPLQNENLLMIIPDGYKTDFREKMSDVLVSEMVPADQTVGNWTEIVRVQIFYELKATTGQFKIEMDKPAHAYVRELSRKLALRRDKMAMPPSRGMKIVP